jgi:hypothetical protein
MGLTWMWLRMKITKGKEERKLDVENSDENNRAPK